MCEEDRLMNIDNQIMREKDNIILCDILDERSTEFKGKTHENKDGINR